LLGRGVPGRIEAPRWNRSGDADGGGLSPATGTGQTRSVTERAEWTCGRASRGIVEKALLDLGFEKPALAREIAEDYRDLREERICLVPGALDVLEQLQTQGVRLGMITNGSASGQRAKIERFGLGSYFEHILIEGEFGLGKPHREVYEAVLGRLESDPAKTWSVGDNLEWDVAAPQTLGMYGIWVDVSGSGILQGAAVQPHRIIRSVSELLPKPRG
jgi:HAD superfamily hydrolase (TIGR01549 family)